MADKTVQRPTTAGLVIAFTAAAGGGDSFLNDGSTYFVVKNAGAASRNVTFDAPNPCSQGVTGAAHDLVVAVANDGIPVEIGPFNRDKFNDATGRVQVSYSDVTSVTVAAVAR